MKGAFLFVCLLPLVFGSFLGGILDTQEIHKLVNAVVEKFGSDATEKQCESECLVLFTNNILDQACDFACLGIQSLIQKVQT